MNARDPVIKDCIMMHRHREFHVGIPDFMIQIIFLEFNDLHVASYCTKKATTKKAEWEAEYGSHKKRVLLIQPTAPFETSSKQTPCNFSKLSPLKTSSAEDDGQLVNGAQTAAANSKSCMLNPTPVFEGEGSSSENKLAASSTEMYFCCCIFHLVIFKMLHLSHHYLLLPVLFAIPTLLSTDLSSLTHSLQLVC